MADGSPLASAASPQEIAGGSMPAFPLQLLVWLSPAFPVGSFAYSHGLEWAVEAGDITDRATAEVWLAGLLAHGAPRNDAILLSGAWRAASAADWGTLRDVNDLALALAGSRERHLEMVSQGNAFMRAVGDAWSVPAFAAAEARLDGDVAYPVAIGVAAAAHGLPLEATVEAAVAGTVSSLVSALVRLAAIGQTDGQRIIAALLPAARSLASHAATAGLDDLGGAAFRSDIAALRHETQETRLFRS